jgi:hypothetical protein
MGLRPLRNQPTGMRSATVESVCECQARLFAQLDEQRRAVRGWARLRGRELAAPANSMRPEHENFNVGWACPFCTRNTLRAFSAAGLAYREPNAPPSPEP